MSETGLSCDYPAWRPPVTLSLAVSEEHPCVYLPNRLAQTRAFWAGQLSSELYRKMMDAGFRRSGRVVYQPICAGCRACLPIRVPVEEFFHNKSQRRTWRRNLDVHVTVSKPEVSSEKYELYCRYLAQWHGRSDPAEMEEFESFLYDSPVQTEEHCYRDPAGRLLAVGICDVGDDWLSSVYFYFDPAEARRGLGTFGALREIESARMRAMKYYYLGYWVKGCGSMEYKAGLGSHEILHPDGVWRRHKEIASDNDVR